MADSNLQRSVTTATARRLATTTKTAPQMGSITPRLLLKLLPWVQVSGGTFRVNRTKVELRKNDRLPIQYVNGVPSFTAKNLKAIPLFSEFDDEILNRLVSSFETKEVDVDKLFVEEGKDKQRFFIVASGQAEVISKGPHGEDLRIALLGDGEYFGEADLLDEQESTVSVRAITPTTFLGLKLKELIKFIKEVPDFRETFEKAVDKQLRLKASVNDNGEKHIDLVSGHEEDNIIPETYIDYEENPTEYSLNTLINNKKFGLLAAANPAYRITTRYGSPTPDDLDELLSLVWKEPAFFIAHPRAIAAFERECTWRGVPPVTTDLFGTRVVLWRGVPLIPSDKVEVEGQYLTGRGVGTTKIILVRVGEKNQGVIGLHQSGIPGEIAPSLSARLMGLDKFGVASYLLTKYFSLAALTDDAIAVLENVEVGYYHDYQHRNKVEK